MSHAVGESVTVRAEFCRGGQYHGTLADGPFFTYLVREDARTPDRGLSPDAIGVGELMISEGGECSHVAETTFIVPDVPAGWYAIDYCNDPCTIDGIYDVDGTGFWIADTPAQAALLMRVDRMRDELDLLRRRARSNRHDAARLPVVERALETARTRLEDALAEVETVRAQLTDAYRRNDALRSRTDGSLVTPSALATAIGILLVTLLIVVLVLLARKRTAIDGADTESAGSGMVRSSRVG
jgi:hypothetical protein